MPDLTDEREAESWTQKRRYLVEDVGIDGFKTDLCSTLAMPEPFPG